MARKDLDQITKDGDEMKPDYKNWMPKGMVLSGLAATAVFLILFIVFGLTGIISGTLKTVLFIVFLAGMIIGLGVSVWMILLYRAFSYNGKRQMSRQIIEGLAEYVKLPDGGKGLDVVSCPYNRYFAELGCPELTKISCGADDHVYGDLPGLKFERTSTIGRGGECCDFCIRKI